MSRRLRTIATNPTRSAGQAARLPVTCQNAPALAPGGRWPKELDVEQRLLGLLLQYNSRGEGGEVFLVEGCRLMAEYSRAWAEVGASLLEAVRIFGFYRRSVLESLYATGCADDEGQRLFRRTNDFFDALMLDFVSGFYAEEERNQLPCS
jgi:hypothetical protein